MVNEVTSGTGMSPWEAQVVIEVIREVYFATPGNAPLRHGQLLYTCVKAEAGAGVALKDCPMTSVTLSLIGDGDDQIHGAEMLCRHRIGRFCEEARDQGGLLTQEDLAQILSCDARTIRRDIKALKELGIHIPTRGQQKDIGPTLTHKNIILQKLIFEGKNVQTVCRETDHSPEAVIRYTTNFKQVLMCQSKGLDVAQTSFATKLSPRLIEEHLALIEEYKQKYANLPNGEAAQLQNIIEKLDLNTKPRQPISQPTA